MLAVTFVSGNENKARQVRAILGDAVALTHTHLDLVEVQGSVAEIAVAKCRQAAGLLGGPVLVEDTALAFDALNGLPGPYVRPFLDAVGCEGLVGMLAGFSEKGAAAICTFAYAASASAEPILFQGVTRVWAPLCVRAAPPHTAAALTFRERSCSPGAPRRLAGMPSLSRTTSRASRMQRCRPLQRTPSPTAQRPSPSLWRTSRGEPPLANRPSFIH